MYPVSSLILAVLPLRDGKVQQVLENLCHHSGASPSAEALTRDAGLQSRDSAGSSISSCAAYTGVSRSGPREGGRQAGRQAGQEAGRLSGGT